MRPKMKLRGKILAGFAVIFAVTCLSGLLAYRSYRAVGREFRAVNEDIVPDALAMVEVRTEVALLGAGLSSLGRTADPKEWEGVLRSIERIGELVKRHSAHEASQGHEEGRVARDLEDRADRLARLAEHAPILPVAGATQARWNSLLNQLLQERQALAAALDGHLADDMDQLAEGERSIQSIHTAGALSVLAATIASAALALGGASYVARSIVRPIEALRRSSERIGSGDFSHRPDIRTGDEIEQLANAFNGMASRLSKQYSLLEQQIAERTAELSSTNEKLKAEILEHEQTERELRRSESTAQALMEAAPGAALLMEEDGLILAINEEAGCQLGTTPDEALGRIAFDFMPPSVAKTRMINTREVARTAKAMEDEEEIDGRVLLNRLYPVIDPDGAAVRVAVFNRDITDRKRAEDQLKKTMRKLAESNEELQNFAYVASHDLQEPLRMVASYVQLLERRYKGRLDQDADDFIGFAVDGAHRMQQLIGDLLSYSRVGTRGTPFEETSLESVLDAAMANLKIAVEENRARISHSALPTLSVDERQIAQVFQNLIGNAIKFHSDQPPDIRISAEQKANEWLFSVKDNGIGLDEKDAGRIFQMFQRLHNGDEFEGSGIGLAIVKRIVKRHGGRIWVESQPGEGATFYFTIPGATGPLPA